MIYFIVIFLLVYLIFRYDINGDNKNRDFWLRCVVFIFISIAGFRFRIGGDTINYLEFYYHETPNLWEISYEDLFASEIEPLCLLLFSVIYSLGGKFFIVQLLQAIIVNVLLCFFFKKHTQYVFSCFFIYFMWMYIYYDFEELRAGISVVLCLLGNDYLQEKKWMNGYMMYVIAIFFHYSSIFFLLTPLILLLRFNLIGIAMIFISIPASALIVHALGDYLLLFGGDDQISAKALGYVNNDEHVRSAGLLYYLIDVGVPVFYILVSYWYLCIKKMNKTLQQFQPFVILAILLYFMSAQLDIVSRYIHFYAPYLIIFYSTMFIELIKEKAELTKALVITRSFLFFLPLFSFFLITLKSVPPRMINNSYRNYQKYYPYSSIFEKSIIDKREKLYDNLYNINTRHVLINIEEY